MGQPLRREWKGSGESRDVLQPACGRKAMLGPESDILKVCEDGRAQGELHSRAVWQGRRPRGHCRGGTLAPMTDVCDLTSQAQPPASEMPTTAATLIAKTENKDLVNVTTSGKGTVSDVPTSIFGVQT